MKHKEIKLSEKFDRWRAETQVYDLNPEKSLHEINPNILMAATAAWIGCERAFRESINGVLEVLKSESPAVERIAKVYSMLEIL